MTFTYTNGKWTKDGKIVTATEVRAATKPKATGYTGSFLPDPKQESGYAPLPNNPEARAAEMSQRVIESGYAGSVDDVPLWGEGERKLYDGACFCGGAHTAAEHIEMEDDMRHAYD
jgi:hypothetical protein